MTAIAATTMIAGDSAPGWVMGMAVVGLLGGVLAVAVYVWYAIALSKLFPRILQDGWKGWVPVLNEATILSAGGRPAWNVVFYFIPVLQLYGLYLKVLATHSINQRFGRGAGATVLAILVPPVWATLLAWGPPPNPDADRLASLQHGPRRRGVDATNAGAAHAGPGAQSFLATPIPPQGAPGAPAFAQVDPSAPSAPQPGFPPAPFYPPSSEAPHPYDPAPDMTVPIAPRATASAQPFAPSAPAAPATPAPAMPISQGLIDSVPGMHARPVEPQQPAPPTQQPEPVAPASAQGFPPPPPVAAPAPPAYAPAAPEPVQPAAAPEPVAPPAYAPAAAPEPVAPPAYAPAAAPEPVIPEPAAPAYAPPGYTPPEPATLDRAPVTPAPPVEKEPLTTAGSAARAEWEAGIRPVPISLPVPEVVAPEPEPVADPDDDDFDATVVVSRRRGVRRVIVLDDGRTFALSATSIVIGRNPDGEAGEQRLAIPDRTRTLSKTHARLVVQGDEWLLTDLHSTNGVVVVADDGHETLLDAGESVTGAGRFILGEVGMHVDMESDS